MNKVMREINWNHTYATLRSFWNWLMELAKSSHESFILLLCLHLNKSINQLIVISLARQTTRDYVTSGCRDKNVKSLNSLWFAIKITLYLERRTFAKEFNTHLTHHRLWGTDLKNMTSPAHVLNLNVLPLTYRSWGKSCKRAKSGPRATSVHTCSENGWRAHSALIGSTLLLSVYVTKCPPSTLSASVEAHSFFIAENSVYSSSQLNSISNLTNYTEMFLPLEFKLN